MRDETFGQQSIVLPVGNGPGTSRIVIGSDLPPPLTTYLFNGTSLAVGGIIFYGTVEDHYTFLVLVPDALAHYLWLGHVVGGAMVEESTFHPAGQSWISYNTGFVETDVLNYLRLVLDQAAGPADDFTINSVSQSRGLLEATWTDNGTVATSAGAEAAVPSASWDNEATYTFHPDRIYALQARGAMLPSLAGQLAAVRVRKGAATVVGGQMLVTIINSSLGGTPVSFDEVGYVKNTSGASISTKLSMTVQFLAGAGTSSLYGDGNRTISIVPTDVASLTGNPTLAAIAVPL